MLRFALFSLAFLVSAHAMEAAESVTARQEASAPDALIDFDTEVMPLLTRQGCNAGSCHGAAIGRGGFKLSLLGSNAAADYDAIVRQLQGRRVHLTTPSRSLLLRKPSEQMSHEGGLAMEEGSEGYKIVKQWIQQGAKRLQSRQLVSLKITPEEIFVEKPGRSITIRVTATYGSGEQEDVTRWTTLKASDSDAVSISPEGDSLRVHRRGVHTVIGRYLDRVLPIRVTVPMHSELSGANSIVGDRAGNRIDEFVDDQLSTLRLPASPRCDDWTFVRRVTLDLCGRLPTVEEATAFAANTETDKRETLVERLLQSEAFADYWALKWANFLGIDAGRLQPQGAEAFQRWIATQLHHSVPLDQMAQEMITATGDSFEQGAVNFLRSGNNPGELAEQVSRVFMGVRLQCANCHDHPLDHWKQDDYHGLAAVFAKLDRGRVVSVNPRGEVTHPVTGEPAIQRIPGEGYLDESDDGRAAFARWLTAQDNPYFARAAVNRVWSELMGRGLVDPVDDLRMTNPATHPQLLDWLAQDFRQHDASLKHTIATICNSLAYQRSSRTALGNEADAAYYSHAAVKPLEAEVVADAIADLTGIAIQAGGEPVEKAVALTNNRLEAPSLDVLGRCDRENDCGVASGSNGSLATSLHLINGELVNRRIAAEQTPLDELLESGSTNAEILDQLFLAALTQPAASQEDYWQEQLASVAGASDSQRREFFEDVWWGLLTSRSFASNR